MTTARHQRSRKQQLGQFYTPPGIAAAIVADLALTPAMRVLEPAFGEGAFIFAVVDEMARRFSQAAAAQFARERLFGVEILPSACQALAQEWQQRPWLGELPPGIRAGDYFEAAPPAEPYDLIIGNPPFGGSFEPAAEDRLDRQYGWRGGHKIKKETYAFFIVKCLDELKSGGKLVFICSDSILSLSTLGGLRRHLMQSCDIDVRALPGQFSETRQQMVLLTLTKRESPAPPVLFGTELPLKAIFATPTASWRVTPETAGFFTGECLGDKMTASAGMTTGNNALFLREIQPDGTIIEPCEFSLSRVPLTAENARARLRKVTPASERKIARLIAEGATENVLTVTPLDSPKRIRLPHPDYRLYNKAVSRSLYAAPKWAIFWRDGGEYVYTYKKTGNWYLHGIGGKAFFGREGLTWPLIASGFRMRYLPPGFILDCGAPVAVLKPGVPEEELFFILGWCLTTLCNRLLKTVLNHTKNIQAKDFERLPYPVWVTPEDKTELIAALRSWVDSAKADPDFQPDFAYLDRKFRPHPQH